MNEFLEDDAESLESDFGVLEGALLSDTVKLLAPSEPITLPPEATVDEAVGKMVANRRAGVLVVDAEGRLTGIFTERDVLTRVVGLGRDTRQTRLAEVMTPEPESLSPDDRICYAINRMNNAGYRTVPIVDANRRPIGVATVNDVIKWLATIFPEAVLNLRPGDRLKRPRELHAG